MIVITPITRVFAEGIENYGWITVIDYPLNVCVYVRAINYSIISLIDAIDRLSAAFGSWTLGEIYLGRRETHYLWWNPIERQWLTLSLCSPHICVRLSNIETCKLAVVIIISLQENTASYLHKHFSLVYLYCCLFFCFLPSLLRFAFNFFLSHDYFVVFVIVPVKFLKSDLCNG